LLLSTIVLTIIGICFALGALDSVFGNRLKVGSIFLETFRKMGAVTLGVMGLYSLAPAAAEGAGMLLRPVAAFLRMDPAAFPSLLFPVDMGGYPLCKELAQDPLLGAFFGTVASSIFGATVGYCIPVSSNLVDRKLHPELALGTLSGLVAIPVALFVGGLVAGIAPLMLAINLIPTLIMSILLCVGLLRKPALMTRIFTGFGRVMSAIGLVGIVLQALRALNIWTPLPTLAPLEDALVVIMRIVISMTGAMVFLTLITRLLRKPMEALGKRAKVDGSTIAGVFAAMVAALIIYSDFDKYPRRGRVMLAAVCASAAFVFGGQLGVVSAWEPSMVTPFFIAKFLAGILAVPLAMWLYGRQEKAE
jgi:ethanolamine transporter